MRRVRSVSNGWFIVIAAIGFFCLIAQTALGLALPILVMEAANDSWMRLHIELILVAAMCGGCMSVSGYFALLSLID